MKKHILACLLISIGLNLSAQKIKTKKDIISVDGVEVAQLAKRENKKAKEKTIVFYDMARQDSVSFTKYTLAPQEIYYGIRTSLSADTADMKLEMLSFTFNEEKALTELIIKEHNFFDGKGFHKQTIKDYIENQDTKEIPLALEALAEEKAKNQEIDAMKLAVSNAWEITRGGQVIGRIKNAATMFLPQTGTPISFLDNKGNEFARITHINDIGRIYTIETFDKDSYECKIEESFSMESFRPKLLTSVVRFLAKEEYLPGQDLSLDVAEKEAAAKSKGELAKQDATIRSKTLVYGELKLINGATLFGYFDCQFRQTEEGNMKDYTNAPQASSYNYGGHGITYYEGTERADIASGNFPNLESPKGYSASKIDYFTINRTYDIDGKPKNVEEAYGGITYRTKMNGKGILGSLASIGEVDRLALILTPRNYITLYFFSGIYILNRELAGRKYKSMARDYFTKKWSRLIYFC